MWRQLRIPFVIAHHQPLFLLLCCIFWNKRNNVAHPAIVLHATFVAAHHNPG
jgi:hypothetical protein